MTLSGIWRWAPFYDVADAGGAGAPSEPVSPVADTSDGESSLAEHEASFGADAKPTEPAVVEPKPAPKPRHRAQSQQATAEDVPRIQELTRKLREAEERATAAESRRESAREEPKPAAAAKPPAFRFQTFEQWSAIPGNEVAEGKEAEAWYRYDDERSEARYEFRRNQERIAEAIEADRRSFGEHVSAYSKKIDTFIVDHPDFDEVVASAPKVSMVMERAALELGPEAAYYLATHHEERDALTADTVNVDPRNPAFKAAVALMRRSLSSLLSASVASEQRASLPSRTAAGSTGAALALVTPTAPKPPTPVRTGALRHEAMPSDDAPLDEHERAYYPKQKQARG